VSSCDERHPWFDRRRTPQDEFYHLRQVVYVCERPVHAAMVEMDSEDVFLTKKDDWAYEKEWRVIAPVQDADNVLGVVDDAVYLFSFPPECVISVVLGNRMRIEDRKQLLALVGTDERYRHVKVREVLLDEPRGLLVRNVPGG
jgi:hypothetical protein